MAQIVPRDSIGGRLGAGLSTGLEQLAQLKMNQYSNRQVMQQAQGRLQNIGLAPEEAAYVATLPPQQQFEVVQALFRAGGGQEQPQQLQQQPMMPQEGIASQGPLGQTGLQQLAPQPQPAAPVQPQINVQAPEQKAPSVPDALKKPVSSKEVAKGIIEAQQQLQQAQPKKPGLREALAAPTRAEEFKIQQNIDKETKKFYDEILITADAAKKSDLRLNKMEKLVKKGKLPISALYNVIRGLEEISPVHTAAAGAAIGSVFGPGGIAAGAGLGTALGGAIGSLVSPIASVLRSVQRKTSPDTEEFEKLSADFVKDAKSFFGGRITDADLKAFMQTIPSLSQTDAGKLKIINNIKTFNEASIAKAEAMKEIIRENKGKRPANLQILVEERASEKLDELAEEFQAR